MRVFGNDLLEEITLRSNNDRRLTRRSRHLMEVLEARTLLSVTWAQLPHTPLYTEGDRSYWYSERADELCHYRVDGGVDTYTIAAAPISQQNVVQTGFSYAVRGADSNLWFIKTTTIGTVLGRLNVTDGSVAYFDTATSNIKRALTVGSDGNVWYLNNHPSNNAVISKVTSEGVITDYVVPPPTDSGSYYSCNDLVVGADQNIWGIFQQNWPPSPFGTLDFLPSNFSTRYFLGRITPDGQFSFVTEFAGLSANNLLLGPDGNFWFTYSSMPSYQSTLGVENITYLNDLTYGIGRITPTGTLATFATPVIPNKPAFGSDGVLYFNGDNSLIYLCSTYLNYDNSLILRRPGTTQQYTLQRMNTEGTLLEPLTLTMASNYSSFGVTADPDGNLLAGNLRININTAIGNVLPGEHIIAVGVGPSAVTPPLQVVDAETGLVRYSINAYSATEFPGFCGGYHVDMADVNGDNVPDIITVPGTGGNSLIKVFSGVDGTLLSTFFGFNPVDYPGYAGDTSITVADANGDGAVEIFVSPAFVGSVPLVRVFNTAGVETGNFYGFSTAFKCGVHVAVGDLDGDGTFEIIPVPANDGFNQIPIRFLNPVTYQIMNPTAPSPGTGQLAVMPIEYWSKGGDVALVDINGNGVKELIVYSLGRTSFYTYHNVRFWSSGPLLDLPLTSGSQLGAGDIDQDGREDILIGRSDGSISVFDISGGMTQRSYPEIRRYHVLDTDATLFPAYA